MHEKRGQVGFSLLEAIVALTILATAGLALFAAMNQSVQMAQRVEQARLADSAVRNAMAWMETVNPALAPSGEQRLGDVDLRWQSELVEPSRNSMTGHLQAGLFEVGLYTVTLDLRRDGQLLTTTQIRRVGYRQVREPDRL
ncbi:PulJ/GspJ family protein [Luteimonas terrae]|nr:type II secretion system protein [Luteimonas terrae]